MNKEEIHEKLEQAFGHLAESNWREKALQRQRNKAWLKHSRKIAVAVLRSIRAQQITQVQLAAMLGVTPQQVNKWLKGNGNFTLETISKLESALNLELVQITGTPKSRKIPVLKEYEKNLNYEIVKLRRFKTLGETKVIPINISRTVSSDTSLSSYG